MKTITCRAISVLCAIENSLNVFVSRNCLKSPHVPSSVIITVMLPAMQYPNSCVTLGCGWSIFKLLNPCRTRFTILSEKNIRISWFYFLNWTRPKISFIFRRKSGKGDSGREIGIYYITNASYLPQPNQLTLCFSINLFPSKFSNLVLEFNYHILTIWLKLN